MSFYTILILINAAAIAAILGFILLRVLRLKNNKEPEPENLTPFFSDDVLEGAHLERVLGVALLALVVVVLGLLAYFIWEPFRETAAASGFHAQSVERGATLFANAQGKAYNSTKSLLCANCHGVDGGGGVATAVVKSEDPRCDPTAAVTADTPSYCLPQQVSWAAPNLQFAPLRYSRGQLTNIITYGRPGTPMPAWGVASGKGALQEQSIQDLVNYVESLVTTSTKAQAADAAETASCTSRRRVRRAQAARGSQDPGGGRQVGHRCPGRTGGGHRRARRGSGHPNRHLRQAGGGEAGDRPGRGELAADDAVADRWRDLLRQQLRTLPYRGWSYFDASNPEANPPPGIMGGGAVRPESHRW